MTDDTATSGRTEWIVLGVILLLFAVLSVIGITWGLPGRNIDKYLFGDQEPWAGEKIYRLAGAGEKFSPYRGADVDVDPLDTSSTEPIPLTASEEDVAKIYLRYRLYTYQPDEMITMMALAGMNPRGFDFDPRLYQYGGLFIYPTGALIAACDVVGLIDVRSDVVYYLDDPAEFGKFYIVARAYAAAWGLIGVVVVFALARRLGGSRAGLLAALLFTLMPVVVCMAHEGKPHLPGAVLMLMAVLFAMRYLNQRAAGLSLRGATAGGMGKRSLPVDETSSPTDGRGRAESNVAQDDPDIVKPGREWWLMCICCGAAFGTVLSSLPIFILIPVVAWRAAGLSLRGSTTGGMGKRSLPVKDRGNLASAFGYAARRTIVGLALAGLVYLITNPYIVINAITNREVLKSNFGNSLAMYEIARVVEGFVRVLELTIEGATLPILVLGVVALIVALVRKNGLIVSLAVPAVVLFVQFVLIGAGKPAEYGRFGIFSNTALAIGTACLLTRRWTKLREIVNWVPASFVTIWVALFGAGYLCNFYADTTEGCSRIRLAEDYSRPAPMPEKGFDVVPIAVLADPAPYCLPPLDFSRRKIELLGSPEQVETYQGNTLSILIQAVDRRPESPTGRTPDPVETAFYRPAEVFTEPEPSGTYRALTRWIRMRETPISWANKPFHCEWVERSPGDHGPADFGRHDNADPKE